LRKKVPAHEARALRQKLQAIARDPFAHRTDVTALSGRSSEFRVRQGNWRALYVVEQDRRTLKVIIVAHRSETY